VKRVLVTGGTGFIGRALVKELAAGGCEVRCAVRPGRTAPGAGVATVDVPDIGPQTDWSAAVTGIDAVIHLAGLAHVPEGAAADIEGEFMRVNAGGTASLAAAAARAGVRRMLLVSSIGVCGAHTAERPFTEDDAPHPVGPYARSKHRAEEELKRAAAAGGMEWCIVRPPLVYGPGARGNFGRLVALVRSGLPLPLGRATGKRSLIGQRNLNSVLTRAIEHPAAANELFLASDGEDLSSADLARAIASALGRRTRLLPVPVGVLRVAFAAIGRSGDAVRLFEPLQVDSSRVRACLGWVPPVGVPEGIREAVAGAGA
jgi:nucleoside-diphosphate-sugar epimerase